MDLGIAGRRAIICGSSRGLGRACAESLAAAGVGVVINGRDPATLRRAVADLEARFPVSVIGIEADVATEDGRRRLLEALPEPDILVTNAAGPPLGDFRDWSRDVWIEALDRMMLAPILLMRQTVDAMCRRGFGRIVNITSVAVRMPAPDRGLTNATKAGLTGFSTGLARQLAARNVTINNILPGLCDTDRGREAIAQRAARAGESLAAYEATVTAAIPAGRLGDPAGFGDLCAFLCSARSAYITRQNILYDGGWYPGHA